MRYKDSMIDLTTLLNAVLAMLSILNPITVVPMYSELTKDLDKESRTRLFNVATLAGFATLTILTFTGRLIMQYVFQINVAEFRIAGGILLMVIAINQIVFYSPGEYRGDPRKAMEMGVVPMAVPLLVGPGSIVTGILILDRDGWLVALIALVVNFIIAFVIIRSSVRLARVMGPLGTLVIARVLWIFIAAIAVRFVLSGISEVFGIRLSFAGQ
jgi:multiple antibiotic resistance protein